MIVSFKHNFVFIKTWKTAGTSIEIALTPYCGPGDVLTPITIDDERSRMIDGKVKARNFATPELEETYRQALLSGNRHELRQIKWILKQSHVYFYNHLTGIAAETRLPNDFWRSALKFTIVRHPFDRAVSAAYHAAPQDLSDEQLSARIDRVLTSVASDIKAYTKDNNLIVDEVIRHSHIQTDLNRILARIGLPSVDDLPRAKGGYRQKRTPSHDILSDRQKRILLDTCRLEFELFGYEH